MERTRYCPKHPLVALNVQGICRECDREAQRAEREKQAAAAGATGEKPPPESPITSAWEVFAALSCPPTLPPAQRGYMQHAFYAGARSTFRAVVDAMEEAAKNDEDTAEQRFASIEIEIERYFRDVIARAVIAPAGKVD